MSTMSVFSFDNHSTGLNSANRPLALANLRRIRWAMMLATGVNIALWSVIGFGVVDLARHL
jgi:hypothetical protein